MKFVVRNRFIPVGSFAALNFCGILFVRRGVKLRVSLIRHERIHTIQMRELWFVGFYIIYVFEWLFRLACLRDGLQAYHAIRFEREAYHHQSDSSYFLHRKPFAWRYE